MTSISLSELAQLCGARLEGDAARQVTGPASLEEASSAEVSFLAESRYLPRLAETRAAAVIVPDGVESPRDDLALLRCSDPQRAFNRVVLAFAPRRARPENGVHPSAVVDSSAEVSPAASIGPLCVVGAGARIAAGAVLHARVTLGPACGVGADSVLHPGVVLYPHVTVGERCILHSGAVIGADGFGFEPGPDGWEKTPQGGTVVIEDDVEIGANVTIDCARFKATHIESNVKIDNLVHVAHNVRLGRSSMLLAQSAVAGSTTVGPWAIVAGQAGVAGHLQIGARARVGGASAVFRDIPAGEDWWGVPAAPKIETIKRHKSLERLVDLTRELRALRERVQQLEERER
jgi:UDP-3-O-[3-hydroxymyristoyl] glucosamine N-acyltransferase